MSIERERGQKRIDGEEQTDNLACGPRYNRETECLTTRQPVDLTQGLGSATYQT